MEDVVHEQELLSQRSLFFTEQIRHPLLYFLRSHLHFPVTVKRQPTSSQEITLEDPSRELLMSSELRKRWQQQTDLEALDQWLRLQVSKLQGQASAGSPKLPKKLSQAELQPTFWQYAWELLEANLTQQKVVVKLLDPFASAAFQKALTVVGGLNALSESDRSLALQLTLNLLPPSEQEWMEGVYLQQIEISVLAEAKGISRETATAALRRARHNFMRKLWRWTALLG